MKILFLTHQYFPAHVGGTEIYLKGIAQHAKKAGHEVEILTCCELASTDPKDFCEKQIVHEGIYVTELHFNLSSCPQPSKSEYKNLLTKRFVEKKIKSFRPDAVHVFHGMKLSGSALEACHQAKIPMIISLCDFWFLCPRHTLLKWNGELCDGPNSRFACRRCVEDLHGFASLKTPRSVCRLPGDLFAISKRQKYLRDQVIQAKQIIALSYFQKDLFVKNGFPENSIKVLHHGIDLPKITTPSRKGNKNIGFIGHLVPFKGAHILLEAFRKLPSLDLECLIFGALSDTPYCHKLRALADQDSRIKFMGGFEPSALDSVMNQIDTLAMPVLWYENEPLVVKVALSRGIPILASRLGSLPDMFREPVHGMFIDPGSVDDWAKGIQKHLSRPPLSFSPPPIKTVEENASEILSLYQDL